MKIKLLKVGAWKAQLAAVDPEEHLELNWEPGVSGDSLYCTRLRYNKHYQAVLVHYVFNRPRRQLTVGDALQFLDTVADDTPVYAFEQGAYEEVFKPIRKVSGAGLQIADLEFYPPSPDPNEDEDGRYGKDIEDNRPPAPKPVKYRVDANGAAVFPEGIKRIDSRAFNDNKKLRSVVIPKGVEEIAESAFDGCSNLQSVTIPMGVRYIGLSAFSRCPALTSIRIPSSVEEILRWSLGDCTGLKQVWFGDGVKEIQADAFNNEVYDDEEFTEIRVSIGAKTKIDYPEDLPPFVKIIRRGGASVKESTKVTLTFGQLKRLIKES